MLSNLYNFIYCGVILFLLLQITITLLKLINKKSKNVTRQNTKLYMLLGMIETVLLIVAIIIEGMHIFMLILLQKSILALSIVFALTIILFVLFEIRMCVEDIKHNI